MKSQPLFLRYIFYAFLVTPILTSFFQANQLKNNSFLIADLNNLNKDKDIHSSFEESNDSFFPSNPMELMNVLRSFDSLNNDSTSPSDAIDAAIEAFENQDQTDSFFDSGDN